MIAWLIPLVGERFAKPAFFALLALLLVGGGFTVAKCSGGNRAAEQQAEQTTASGEAMADAAETAIGTISNRAVNEADIDNATAIVMEQIDNAANPDDIRNAVLDGVCNQKSHRNDPACTLR